jgi:hypothetical protein
MLIDTKNLHLPAKHPLAGTFLKLGTHVYRYTDSGGTVLVAIGISEEAAQAAYRLLSL